MYYRVTAQLKKDTAADLHRKLTDGTIQAQKPDGGEIVSSMNRAVLQDDGSVAWSELCYCPTPLAHERATVLDHHFDDMTTEEIASHEDYEGAPFMEHLARLAEA